MSDEFGDYAGDEQNTIRMLMETCVHCEAELSFDDDAGWVSRYKPDTCAAVGYEHEPILSDKDMEWAVCGTCHGKGTSSLYLGSFSAEALWEDPEFAEEYMEGRYDKPCPECGGRTTVRAIREGAAKHQVQIDEWFKGMYELRAEEAAERRMGA